jgi:hypothetical protein
VKHNTARCGCGAIVTLPSLKASAYRARCEACVRKASAASPAPGGLLETKTLRVKLTPDEPCERRWVSPPHGDVHYHRHFQGPPSADFLREQIVTHTGRRSGKTVAVAVLLDFVARLGVRGRLRRAARRVIADKTLYAARPAFASARGCTCWLCRPVHRLYWDGV